MKRLILFLIFLIALAFPAYAQWEYGGKTIGIYSGNTNHLAVANLGSGKTVVAWNGIDGGEYAIFATCIDSAGYALWGDMGMVVYNDSNYLEYPAVLNDGHGGAFVVWGDWRHTWAQGICLYGQHLDSLGNKLWPDEGKRLTADTMSQSKAHLYDDGHGGFIAIYENLHGRSDIGAQRVDADGNILWDSTGIFLTTAEYDQNHPKTCKVDNNSFVTIWLDDRFYFNPDSSFYGLDIYMQKFNIYGNILWAQNGIPAVHASGNQGYAENGHDVAPDGHGGSVAAWVDWRNQGYNPILYADRFSPSGQSMWYSGGEALGDPRTDYALYCQAFRLDSSDTYMIRWGGTNSGAPSRFYFSHLGFFGDPIGGRFLVLDTVAVMNSFMDPEGMFKYFTGYVDSSGGRAIGRKCDMTGHQYWPDFPKISSDMLILTDELRTDNAGGMIVVWMESSHNNIAIARIYADGHAGGDTTDVIVDPNNPIATKFGLSQNYPNPFNGMTNISYNLPSASNVSFLIFDITGRIIRRLVHNECQEAGIHSYIWDGTNNSGIAVSTAIYFYQLQIDEHKMVKSMILIK